MGAAQPEASEEGTPSVATIVIADLDSAFVLSMQATLEGEGHTVHTALDGYEALTLCQGVDPDLVFLATNLAVLTGEAVTEALRDDPDMPPDLPIILICGEDPNIRAVEQCGATGWMARGLESHALRERVVDWLGSRAGLE